jgi:hypothetical protein
MKNEMLYHHCFSTLLRNTPLARSRTTSEVELDGTHDLVFRAVDVNLLGKNTNIKKTLGRLINITKKVGLKVNAKKTKYTIVYRH